MTTIYPYTIQGIDTNIDISATASNLHATGIRFVGRYIEPPANRRPSSLTLAEVNRWHAAQVKILPIFERNPVNRAYLTSTRGEEDGAAMYTARIALGVPRFTPCFYCIDYDANPTDVLPYSCALWLHIRQTMQSNQPIGVYGSGAVIAAIAQAGFIDFGWLAQSQGWAGYSLYTPQTAIIQNAHQPDDDGRFDKDACNSTLYDRLW